MPPEAEVRRHDYLSAPQVPDSPGGARVVLADPPYNIGVDYAGDGSGDRLPDSKYRLLCQKALRHHARVLAPGGTCWWVVPAGHLEWLGPMMESAIGPRLYLIVWEEAFAQYQRHDLTSDFRLIVVHANDRGPVYRDMDAIRVRSVRQDMGDKRADPQGRVPGRVWRFRRLQGTSTDRVGWHPAQLPPELLQRIVLGWSARGDLVVDGFAGSGSLGVECLRMGRRFVGLERSAEYVKKANQRLRTVAKELSDGNV